MNSSNTKAPKAVPLPRKREYSMLLHCPVCEHVLPVNMVAGQQCYFCHTVAYVAMSWVKLPDSAPSNGSGSPGNGY